MLDRDPNANQPPDPSSVSRVRSRSHKPKNAPKKQPQRGLGVAQLEKLRLEEQSKQQEAICLASLQHQNFHHHGHVHHQQEQYTPHFLHHQHFPFQQQNLSQSSSLCLSRQIKLLEPPLEKASFPLSFVKLNVAPNSLLPLTVTASREQAPSLPLLIPQQHLGCNEDETSLSPLSNAPDLCSPCHVRPSSAESRLCPALVPTPPAARGENPWLSHLYDRDSIKEKDSTITFLSSASCSDSDTRLQSLDPGLTESTNAAMSNLHGNIHISMEKQASTHGREGTPTPFTELCLSGHHPVGAFGLHIPSRISRLEPPPAVLVEASVAAGGVQMRELSSFQTISLCPTRSPADKVSNRKRSWACTQELVKQSEPAAFRGVDLNISVDEMESADAEERDSNLSLPFAARDDFKRLPVISPKKSTSENTLKALLADHSCRECGLMKAENAFPDMCFNGSTFLSLRKESLDHEKWDPEMSGDFLTLGPSCSSVQVIRNDQRCIGNYCTCHPVRKLGENASSWPSQQEYIEQAKGGHVFAVTTAAGDHSTIRLMGYQPSYYSTVLRMENCAMLSKTEGYSTCDPRESNTDESLDLELRLAL